MSGTANFYAGFEGEPELVVEAWRDEELLGRVDAWMGYFDTLMEACEAGPDGRHGLSLAYHVQSPWFYEQEWQDPNPRSTVEIVSGALSKVEDPQVRAVGKAIISLASACLEHGGRLFFRVE